MGLSASQARLLSITARLSDNELHSQQIANAKVRLADQSQEASREYVNALDTQKLMYTMYDAKGNATQINLTPALMYDFAEMKNQYGISNATGQLLISTADALNYKTSANLIEYLQKNGVQMVHNDAYDDMIELIYADRTDLYDPTSRETIYQYANISSYKTLSTAINGLNVQPNTLTESSTADDIENYVKDCTSQISDYNSARGPYDLRMSGTEPTWAIHDDLKSGNPEYAYGTVFTNYVNSLYSPPNFGDIKAPEKPKAPNPADYDIAPYPGSKPKPETYHTDPTSEPNPSDPKYLNLLLKPVCWGDTGIVGLLNGTRTTNLTPNEIIHMEHVLAQFVWPDGYSAGTLSTPDGDITKKATTTWGVSGGGASNSTKPTIAEVDPKGIQTITLAKSENSELKANLQQLYFQVCQYLQSKDEEYPATTYNHINYTEIVVNNGVGAMYDRCANISVNAYEYWNVESGEPVMYRQITKMVSVNRTTGEEEGEMDISGKKLWLKVTKDGTATYVGENKPNSANVATKMWYLDSMATATEIWDESTITAKYKNLMKQLGAAAAVDSVEYKAEQEKWDNQDKEYDKALEEWTENERRYLEYRDVTYPALVQTYREEATEYANKVSEFINKTVKSWQQSVEYNRSLYTKQLDNVPKSEIIDETDPKVAWYTNLWHRLNGESDSNTNLTIKNGKAVLDVDATSNTRWKILDDSSFKSAAWLQYALEHGIVTLEQVQKAEDIETETGLTTTKWQSKSYTTCTDIQFVDDETAIARAEAIYTKKLNEIEAKDKQYDNDIKKLDTEHNALQTEYESVKSVIDKNIDRSFKAFS